jgi:hypothetical protein
VRGYVLVFAIGFAIAFACPVSAQQRTFGGYPCKHECDLYVAEYEWAKVRVSTTGDFVFTGVPVKGVLLMSRTLSQRARR